MYLRSTSLVYPRLYLLTLGETCRYLVADSADSLLLSDPGLSCHVALLPQRFTRIGYNISKVTHVVLTNTDPIRIAGIPTLRRFSPYAQVYGTAAMYSFLSDTKNVKKLYDFDQELTARLNLTIEIPRLTFEEYRSAFTIDKYINDSDVISPGPETSLRVVSTPGHRELSVAYLLLPHEFIIADQTFGYYNGNKLATPGADFNLSLACESIRKFDHLELSGLGLPYGGALTGELVKRHLQGVIQNTEDLMASVKEATNSGMSPADVLIQIRDAFFSPESRDPFLRSALAETEAAFAGQLKLSSSAQQ
jgi:glyoxylase-like metal-dependent hydrolase (beta-lactamase superfamily II)